MERIVEYKMSREEIDNLDAHLKEVGYESHGYRGMSKFTIDDGVSKSFEGCKQFSVFEFSKEGNFVKLRIKNSDLVKAVDSYFEKKRII